MLLTSCKRANPLNKKRTREVLLKRYPSPEDIADMVLSSISGLSYKKHF
jgi:hypothetical protein